MSFIAKLQLQNEDELNVLRCSFRFNQQINPTGHTVSIPIGGTIKLLLASNGDTSLLEWMINHQQTKNGTITFIRYDTMSKLKTLEFENALCIGYYETFDPAVDHPMKLELTISAHTLRVNDTVFQNKWPGLR
jgi:hypothetical protein